MVRAATQRSEHGGHANGRGIRIFAPELKSFALCDGLHMPHVKARYAARAGIIEKPGDMTPEIDGQFTFLIAGVNHFTWLIRANGIHRPCLSMRRWKCSGNIA